MSATNPMSGRAFANNLGKSQSKVGPAHWSDSSDCNVSIHFGTSPANITVSPITERGNAKVTTPRGF